MHGPAVDIDRPTADDSDAAKGALRQTVDRAATIAALHMGRDGMCAACLDMWAWLAPTPCDQARWASRLLADNDHRARSSSNKDTTA